MESCTLPPNWGEGEGGGEKVRNVTLPRIKNHSLIIITIRIIIVIIIIIIITTIIIIMIIIIMMII